VRPSQLNYGIPLSVSLIPITDFGSEVMSERHYKTERTNCENALATAVAVSDRGIGLLTGWQGHWGAFLHARTIVNTITVFDIVDAALAPPTGRRPLDHFSVASVARTAVEAGLMMLYVSDPDLSPEEWDLRHLILQLHDTSHRSRMFRSQESGGNGEEVKKMRAEYRLHIDRIIGEVKANSAFAKLKAEQQDRIVRCQDFYIGGIRNAVRMAGWDVAEYDFFESYFSAYIHSMPMSFFRAEQHDVSFDKISDFQLALCGTALALIGHTLESTTARMEQLINLAEGTSN
jgi:hypothetical protein